MTASLAVRALIVLLGALAAPSPARADSRTQFLAERLKYPPNQGQPDDFRVRTNAALALGATGDDAAVVPLCSALGDPSELVRQAVAVATKRLARGASLECLRKRFPVESNAAVKLQIQRAIEAVEASGGSGASNGASAAPYIADARYYVSISPVVNNTTRPGAEIDTAVRAAIASKLAQLGGFQLAPASESNDAAKTIIARRKLKGFYLAVSVDKLDYSEGNLRVRVKIAVFSYPGKDLRGEVPAGATLPGARPGDKSAEDELITLVSGRAAELFAQNFK
ncbi:MAG: HEAT repeat domain-containing protein [Myxococcota bacterium]|nr:HEAT repeat domain-containing protein [Myxococcota bacterium]